MPFPWPFRTSHAPQQQALAALETRVHQVERDTVALRDDLAAWEARAAKLVREMSRTLKAMAEVQRREDLKAKPADEEEDQEELDLVTRTLRYSRGA